MTLATHGKDIEAALLGELSGADELALREHLRGCDECRAEYDALTGAERLFGESKSQAARGEARVLAAAAERQRLAARGPWGFAVLGAALAAGLLVMVNAATWSSSQEEVRLRGGSGAAQTAPALLVYARAGEAPVRLAADFPGSGEARVKGDELVQFFVRADAEVRFAAVVRVAEPSEVLQAADVDPQTGTTPVGLAMQLGPGRYRLAVVQSPQRLGREQVLRAVKTVLASGTLVVE